jgi:TP901 family phage tail tape measure protein
VSEVGTAYVTIIPSFRGFGTSIASQLSAQTAGIGEAAGTRIGTGIGRGVAKAGASTAAFGKTLSTHLTLPILGIGAASFKVFGEFDQTMRQVGVQTGLSGQALSGMTDLALKLGRDTSFSAGQASDAMLSLAKGGMSAAEIKGGALAQTLTLAAAGGLDLGQAAGTMVETLNTFGLTAADSARVAAALAGGANASTASVQSLGQALSQVGPGARNAGLSVNDTVAALSLFANSGIQGSDAGTSLKTMLTHLVPQTQAAAGAMKKLGLDFTDAHGKFLPLSAVAEQLKTKLGPLTAEQRSLALQTIFGSDAARAATVLMNAGGAGVKKMTAATKDLGAAQKLAATNTQGAKGSMEQMKGSMETAGIVIGKTLAPTVINLAKRVTDLLNQFTKLSPATQGTILKIGGLVAVMGPALLVTGKLVTATGQTVLGVTKVAGAFASTAKAGIGFATGLAQPASGLSAFAGNAQKAGSFISRTLGSGLGAAGKALGMLKGPLMIATGAVKAFTMSLLANPVFLIVAALVALGVTVYVLYQKWKPFRELVDEVGRALKSFGQTVVVGAVAAFHLLKAAGAEAWDALKTGWAIVEPIFAKILDAISQPIQGVIQVFHGFIQVVTGIFTGDFGKIGDGIANIIGGIVRMFLGLPARILGALISFVPMLLSLGLRGMTALLGAIVSGAVAVWNFFIALPGKVIGFLVSLTVKLASLGASAIAALAHAVATGAVAVWNFFIALPGKVFGLLASLAGKLLSVGSAALSAMAHGIVTGAVAVWKFFTALPGKTVSALGDLGSYLLSAGGFLIAGLVQGIANGAEAVVNAAINVVHKVVKSVMKALTSHSPSRVFMDIGKTVTDGFEIGITKGAPTVADAARRMVEQITGVDPTLRIGAVLAPPPRLAPDRFGASAGALAPGRGGPLIGTAVIHEQVDVDVLARRLDFALTGGLAGGVAR